MFMQTIRIENRTIFRVLISVAVFIILGRVLIMIQQPLLWIAASIFLALALNPLVSFLAHYLPRRSRGAGIMLVLLGFFGLLGVIIYSFAPPLIEQSQQLTRSIPNAVDQLQNMHGPFGDIARQYNFGDRVAKASNNIFEYLSTATGSAVNIVGNVFSGIAAGLTIFTLTFFMLLEAPIWMKTFWALNPPKHRERNQLLATQMYRAVTGYVNGNFFTSGIAGVTAAIMLTILGIPYAVPLALIVGIFDLIPLVGASIAAVIVVIVALFTSTSAAIVMAIFFLVYQQVENNVLQPLVYGKSTELTPLVVTIALLIGTVLGGLFGALVAIPIAASIKVILMHLYGERIKAVS